MPKALPPEASQDAGTTPSSQAGAAADRSEEAISGYELARRVLEHEDGGVEALLTLAGGEETDWLEPGERLPAVVPERPIKPRELNPLF